MSLATALPYVLAAWALIIPDIRYQDRVEYKLTELGRSLRDPVQNLGQWAFSNLPEIQGARERFDKNTEPK